MNTAQLVAFAIGSLAVTIVPSVRMPAEDKIARTIGLAIIWSAVVIAEGMHK